MENILPEPLRSKSLKSIRPGPAAAAPALAHELTGVRQLLPGEATAMAHDLTGPRQPTSSQAPTAQEIQPFALTILRGWIFPGKLSD